MPVLDGISLGDELFVAGGCKLGDSFWENIEFRAGNGVYLFITFLLFDHFIYHTQ